MKEMEIILKKEKNEIDEEFNYLDKFEEKEEDNIIELFDELKLENNFKEKKKSDSNISENNKDWFTYCLHKEQKKII